MVKYNRNYLLRIQRRDGTTLEIRRPFTVEFDIHRNQFSSANVASIRIYNLNADNRNQIRKDQFDNGEQRRFDFAAGYGTNLAFAFVGNIQQAWSVREGVNFVTSIECYDGGFAYNNGITNQVFPAGTLEREKIKAIAKDLPGVQMGAIGDFPGQISRGNALSGGTTDLLVEATAGAFFIDNGQVNCLNDNECLQGDIPLINAGSGLLGTPVKEQSFINFDMLFEPSLKIGQLIRLETSTAEHFNGIHKVVSLKHRGTISDAVCGDAITSVGLLPGVLNNGEVFIGGFTPVQQETR